MTTQSALESRMAGTVIINRVINPKAFDGPEYHQCKAETVAKEVLTFEKLKTDLDPDHLKGSMVSNILRILIKYVQELARFKPDVNNIQYKKYSKYHIKPEKMEYHPLKCSSYNEAYTQGNHNVIPDVFVHQLGVSHEFTFTNINMPHLVYLSQMGPSSH